MATEPQPPVSSQGISDVGRNRSANEDAFAICEAERIYAVADGMGGAAAGEVASRLFVEAVHRAGAAFRGEDPGRAAAAPGADTVREIFARANTDIIAHARRHPHHAGLGCTAEVLLIRGQTFLVGHVGDSRTYLLRDGRLNQLTQDHSWVQEQVDGGRMSPEEAREHPMRHLITRAVGTSDQLSVDLISGRIARGDRFLLCSDGLVDMVADREIERVLAADRPIERRAADLVALANAYGGRDNITVLLVEPLVAAASRAG